MRPSISAVVNLLNLTVCFMIAFSACKKKAEPVDTVVPPSANPAIEISNIVSGYEIIWGMDFLPSGDLIFGEKRGRLYRFSNGSITEITGFPTVRTAGQGGLLDIRVHPAYMTNGWIYAAYAATSTANNGELRLVRFKLSGNAVQNLETIFTTGGGNSWNGHYGSRIVFDKSGLLWLSVGEGGSGSYGGPTASNKNASDLNSRWGKIHRMTDAGNIPADNPVFPGQSAPTTIYAYGVRNPQGMAIHPVTGEIWENEHGPKGGDEINIILKGAHYGWPNVSIGVNYDGTNISQGHAATGITEPLYTWTPSIGVCGAAFIQSDAFKSWKGNLLCGGLAAQKLYRCVLEGTKIVSVDVVNGISGRVRNVIQGPDGAMYVSVEGTGRILRLKAS